MICKAYRGHHIKKIHLVFYFEGGAETNASQCPSFFSLVSRDMRTISPM